MMYRVLHQITPHFVEGDLVDGERLHDIPRLLKLKAIEPTEPVDGEPEVSAEDECQQWSEIAAELQEKLNAANAEIAELKAKLSRRRPKSDKQEPAVVDSEPQADSPNPGDPQTQE